MKFNIAAIVSPTIWAFMHEILPDLNSYCNITLLEAGSNLRARELYQQCGQEFDAIVFSGHLYQMYATQNRDEQTPCFSFDTMAADLTSILYQQLLKNRNFDFSRMSIDILPFVDAQKSYTRLFPAQQKPYTLDKSFKSYFDWDSDYGELLTRKILEWHLALYRSGQTDLAVTRFGAIVHDLEAAGVPYVYMLPSKEYISNFILQIVNILTTKAAEEQLVGVVVIECAADDNETSGHLLAKCNEAIAYHALLNGYDFSFTQHQQKLEIVTRHKELSEITSGFSVVPFRELIPHEVRENMFMGLGTGRTQFQARLNAGRALDMAEVADCVFYVSHQGRSSGPLGLKNEEYEARPDEWLFEQSSKLGVDHLVLQKMLACGKVSGSNIMTAHELAEFMGVTRRSASRILNKVVAAGGARIYAENPSGRKGRPTIQYELQLPPPHGEA